MDRVRTSTFVNASGQSLAKPSHFDTVSVVEDLALHKLKGGLSGMFFQVGLYQDINLFFLYFLQCVGLRVAQVQLLFNLPPQFSPFPHPLAYIECFTKLGPPDPTTGLHSITCSTRQGKRNTEVVSVDRIVQVCHLISRFKHTVILLGPLTMFQNRAPSISLSIPILTQILLQYLNLPFLFNKKMNDCSYFYWRKIGIVSK